MGWPKQPGDDAQAHRELAQRNLALAQENRTLRSQLSEARERADQEAHQSELHAEINRKVAEALGLPFGSSWHDLGEKVAAIRERERGLREALERSMKHLRLNGHHNAAEEARAALIHREGGRPVSGPVSDSYRGPEQASEPLEHDMPEMLRRRRFNCLDEAMRVLGGCLHSYTGQQAQEVARAMRRAIEAEREACALLHEQVDVTDGRDPMAVVIDYRDLIRGRP